MSASEEHPPTLQAPTATNTITRSNFLSSNTSSTMTFKQDDVEFIFREEEFEEETFDAAHFVAKYRRVSSLESLREQLVAYSKHIQQHLYLIINRDYKDFITISTKVSFSL